jgi:hypothetical protein
MEQRIAQRSLEDDAFRKQLLADPRAALEQELGTQLPSGSGFRWSRRRPTPCSW